MKITSITEIHQNLLHKLFRVFWKYYAFIIYPHIVFEEGV